VDCEGPRTIATRDQLADFRAERCRSLEGALFLQVPLEDFETLDLGPLASIGGDARILVGGATLVAPVLVDVPGLTIEAGAIELPALEAVTDASLTGETIALPALRSATTLEIDADAVQLDALQSVGSLTTRNATLPALTAVDDVIADSLTAPQLVQAGTISAGVVDLPALETVDVLTAFDSAGIPSLRTANTLAIASQSEDATFALPALESVGTLQLSGGAALVSAPVLVDAGQLSLPQAAVDLPNLETVDILELFPTEPTPYAFPSLTTADALEVQGSATTVDFPALQSLPYASIAAAGPVTMPVLMDAGSISLFLADTPLALPALVSANGLSVTGASDISLPPGIDVGALELLDHGGPVAFDLPAQMDLVRLGYLATDAVALTGVSVIGTLELLDSPSLTSISAPDLATVDDLCLVDLPALTTVDMDALATINITILLQNTGLPPAGTAFLEAAATAGGADSPGFCP
jgi:hypothetical protein